MIYVGYQGIGKSTLCRKHGECVDLESSVFFVDGKRHPEWYKVYARMAEHLSAQGKTVFTSSHKQVRQYMNDSGIAFTAVTPAPSLKDAWTEKLRVRYESSGSEKDYKAWKNCDEMFEQNIQDMMSEKNVTVIESEDYDLGELLGITKNGQK